MIVIPVNSKTHGEQFIFIDGEDFDKVKNHTWGIHKTSRSNKFYARTTVKGKDILMHRLLLDFPQGITDHKNGNSLDNRQENIRACTSAENARNTKKRNCITSSIYKGVYFDKSRQKYLVATKFKGKHVHIGRFENEHDAGAAYNKKAIELFGEFALLNIIQGETTC